MMRVVVPVKRFCFAKERLSCVRTPAERVELARGFAENTLRELAAAKTYSGVAIVSGEDTLRPIARELGFNWLEDPGGGLNAALAYAVATMVGRSCDDIAIVHADLPYFRAAEFDRIAVAHRAGAIRKMTIVADRFGDGTTLRFCRPVRAVPPLYGPGSARRHAAYAQAREIAVEFATSHTLSVDCDTPADLEFLSTGRIAQDLHAGDIAQ